MLIVVSDEYTDLEEGHSVLWAVLSRVEESTFATGYLPETKGKVIARKLFK